MATVVSELPIELDLDAVAEFCRENRIKKMSLFGSVLRDDFTPESDVDVLIEFEEGYRPGIKFFGLGAKLSPIIGREADVMTADSLHDYWRDEVLAEALTIYDAA